MSFPSRLSLTLGLAVLAASPSLAARAEPAQVTIEHYAFGPPDLTVKAGEKVAFLNSDQIPHSVVVQTPDGKTFQSKEQLDEGEIFDVVLSAPGEALYFCGLHPGMKGKITVTK